MREEPDASRLIAELDALIGPGPDLAPPRAASEGGGPASYGGPAAGAEASSVLEVESELSGVRVVPESAPPPSESAPAPGGSAAAAPTAAAGAAKVLVVDDNEDYRRVVAYLLKEQGYRVLEAAEGLAGFALARKNRVHLALIDFDMPGLNGYELVQELRSREETRQVPIIMLTGARNRTQLRELGMSIQAFLEKPISNEALLSAVARVLEETRRDDLAAETEEPAAGPAPEEPAAAKAPPLLADAQAASLLGVAEEENVGELLLEEQKKEKEEEMAGLDVLANESPLVNRVNRLLIRAVEMGASDIHIEPQEKHTIVRVRVNGVLRSFYQMPLALAPQVAARVKIMSNLIITERRRPQDGQVRAMIKGNKVEFRVSTIPSIYGEKIVMRILGGAKLKPSLKEYPLEARDLQVMETALQSPHGLLLVTGPTGSGKSTTLYTMIRMLNTPDVNIMTAEDPVEYELPGITQVQVKAHIGLTFEAILRSFLRQDPDIMLIGEIRDLETVEIAVKAAVTGHVVLSTLHTNSAPASVIRLTHMGVAPYLLADSLKLIVAQRLVRTLCKGCRVEKEVPEDFARLLAPEERERLRAVYDAPGCDKCDRTGYAGRKPIFEVMEVRSAEIRRLIISSRSVDEIARQAVSEGMTNLRAAALKIVANGDTSVTEALNIILSD